MVLYKQDLKKKAMKQRQRNMGGTKGMGGSIFGGR